MAGDDSVKVLLATHVEILQRLTKLGEDHEKRLRMVEKFCFGLFACIGLIEFVWKKG